MISASASSIGIPIGIASSPRGLQICAIAAGVKKYKSIIKKNKKKQDKVVFLAKFKLNKIELLISKTLSTSVISHDDFFLINNVGKEYSKIKEQIKYLKTYCVLWT